MNGDAGDIFAISAAARKIQAVFADIRRYGFSRRKDFSVGHVEKRMRDDARQHDISIAEGDLYMGPKSLSHSRRDVKVNANKAVSEVDIASFPRKRASMDLFYDGEVYVYTDYNSKYIIHPNYQVKTSKGKMKRVNYITATKVVNANEFTQKGSRYRKV